MRLLLVEDDKMIGESVLDLLRADGYAVDWVKDGSMAELCWRDRTTWYCLTWACRARMGSMSCAVCALVAIALRY